ncbi:MAG: hypothetical protein EHJ95_03905, partial [Methanobacteriota archaeon]
PWVREVEATGGSIGSSWHDHKDDLVRGQRNDDGRTKDGTYKRLLKGWHPSCTCDAGEPVPCVVLDPFAGSGTTLKVARDLGRDSIGIELNPAYVGIIKQKLRAAEQLIPGAIVVQAVTP